MRALMWRTGGAENKRCLISFLIVFACASSSAQMNSWINPASGNWDAAANWSLGSLPNSSQTVMITNSNWKAVGINPSTPVNFPGSMTVASLTVRGSTNTENTLLLNFFGTNTPLTVLNGLTLADDGRILNLNSALLVLSGVFIVTNTTMIQDGGFVRAINGQMQFFGSDYFLSNGVFQVDSVLTGIGPGFFNQYGGTA